jgi:hypothetical protein
MMERQSFHRPAGIITFYGCLHLILSNLPYLPQYIKKRLTVNRRFSQDTKMSKDSRPAMFTNEGKYEKMIAEEAAFSLLSACQRGMGINAK